MPNKPTIAYIIAIISVLIIVMLFLNNNSNNAESGPEDWALPEKGEFTTTKPDTIGYAEASSTADGAYFIFNKTSRCLIYNYSNNLILFFPLAPSYN
jgi:hypothetical protein